tara:strand:+ start:15909 stop:17408 length:1500 start_codon:yes stop_codon:yes gene_type:complete
MSHAAFTHMACNSSDIDVTYLFSEHDTTYFSKQFNKLTNFCCCHLSEDIRDDVVFTSKNSRVNKSIKIPSQPDLILGTYLHVTLPANGGDDDPFGSVDVAEVWNAAAAEDTNNPKRSKIEITYYQPADEYMTFMQKVIHEASLEIGGQVVQTLTGQYISLLEDVSSVDRQTDPIGNFYNNFSDLHMGVTNTDGITLSTPKAPQTTPTIFNPDVAENTWTYFHNGQIQELNVGPTDLYFPLPFSFAREPSQALPICAIVHQTIQLNLTLSNSKLLFGPSESFYVTNEDDFIAKNEDLYLRRLENLKAIFSCVFLSESEKLHFMNNEKTFIWDQCREMKVNLNTGINKIKLNYQFPLKYLMWSPERSDRGSGFASTTTNEKLSYVPVHVPDVARTTASMITAVDFLLNNNSAFGFAPLPAKFFRTVAPWERFAKAPQSPLTNCYSFSLYPLAPQPSGSVNVSRMNDFEMVFIVNKAVNLTIWAVGMNVFRVGYGHGSMVYQ